jgi:hypothetical protein
MCTEKKTMKDSIIAKTFLAQESEHCEFHRIGDAKGV